MEFLERLKELQHREILTDQEMADRIGCSRQLYYMVMKDKLPVGYKILKGAVRTFPELRELAVDFLTNGAGRTTGDVQKREYAKRPLG